MTEDEDYLEHMSKQLGILERQDTNALAFPRTILSCTRSAMKSSNEGPSSNVRPNEDFEPDGVARHRTCAGVRDNLGARSKDDALQAWFILPCRTSCDLGRPNK